MRKGGGRRWQGRKRDEQSRVVCPRAYKVRERMIAIVTKCPSKLMFYKQKETGDWQRETVMLTWAPRTV